MEFLKVGTKHNFYYIHYISVYIQPGYLYLIFRSVNVINMNRFILHYVRPPLWGFSTHLDATVQRVAVEPLFNGGDY